MIDSVGRVGEVGVRRAVEGSVGFVTGGLERSLVRTLEVRHSGGFGPSPVFNGLA